MKVFVSSLIKGFEDYRAAARGGVELTTNTPVMAEDLEAQSGSPQEACLEGVRQSDVYIVLFGQRYGNRGASGLSPTEEEFEEAQERRMPVLVFRTAEQLEPDQEAFLRRIAPSWEDGTTYKKFSSSEELKEEVIRALSRLNVSAGLTHEPSQRDFEEELGALVSNREDVGVALAFVPSIRRPIVPLDRIEGLSTQVERILEGSRLAGGTPHLAERSVEFSREGDRDAPYSLAVVRDDLSVGLAAGLRNEERGIGSMDFYLVDRTQLLDVISSFVDVFREILTTQDPRRTIPGGWVQGYVWGIGTRIIRDLPPEPVTSIEIPADLGEGMSFPSTPIPVGYRDLISAELIAATLVGALERQVQDRRRARYG